MMRRWWIVWLVLLAPVVQAASVHAFLDRSHVSLGDTVTLNIQSNGSIGTPDLAPLQRDFRLLGTSRSSSVSIINGKTTRTAQLGIALKPLHAGTLTIPALDIGGAHTQPLSLVVGAAPTGGTGKVGDPVFMQASVLSSSPYIGQETVYTVRLFYLPGIDGTLGEPTVAGARLVKLDRDHQYTTDRDGYTYKVIERSWAVIPQRSGSISVQGPQFRGQRFGAGNLGALLNNPNALLNNPNALLNGQIPGFGKPIEAVAPDVALNARAAPAHAGKPWLPARNVQLKLTGLPANGQVDAGTPLTLTLSISASGQPADALPQPELPPIAGARVYPDQTQDATDNSGQWLQGTRTRSFAIVPEHDGTLTVPAITLAWWNVASDRAEQAELSACTLQVAGGVAATSTAVPPASAAAGVNAARSVAPVASRAVVVPATSNKWRTLALASLVLWLLAIIAAGAWWWRSRRGRVRANQAGVAATSTMAAGVNETPAEAAPPSVVNSRTLQHRALEAARAGDAAACEHALLAWAHKLRPNITRVDALGEALVDPAQRDAVDALQRARWQGGDAASACAAVTHAFARGFAWRDSHARERPDAGELPPLYPLSK